MQQTVVGVFRVNWSNTLVKWRVTSWRSRSTVRQWNRWNVIWRICHNPVDLWTPSCNRFTSTRSLYIIFSAV